MAQFPSGVPYNYMLHSLNQFCYPGYQYLPPQYAGANYASAMQISWTNFQYGGGGMNGSSAQPRNFAYP